MKAARTDEARGRLWTRFWRRQDGAVAVQFAVLALPLTVIAFGLYDLNRASVAKRTLQDALDAATLMAARSSASDDAGLQSVGSGALNGQLEAAADMDLTGSNFESAGSAVVSTATAHVTPVIANLWLGGDMEVNAESEVMRGMNRLEVALVLDNTGSMAGSKLRNLKTAAKNLIDTLSAAADRSTEDDAIKIGIVPFSQTVNIGSTYKNKNWMDKSAANPISQEIFTSTANRFALFNQMNEDWAGCVESRPQPYDVQDTAPSNGNKETLFVPYFAPDEPDEGYGWANNYLDDDVDEIKHAKWDAEHGDDDEDDGRGRGRGRGRGGRDDDDWEDVDVSWQERQGYVGKYDDEPSSWSGKGPNYGCDMQPLMRLTTDWGDLKDLIDDMNATGNTNIGMGAMWGWHVLSPKKPFADGVAYDTPKTTKIAIIMTDGDNTFPGSYNGNDSAYNGMGYIWQGRLGITSGSDYTRTSKMDERLEKVCENMQAKEIIIYTVRVEVKSGSSSLLRGCATDGDKFYDVQDADELNSVFQDIAGDITSMRISR